MRMPETVTVKCRPTVAYWVQIDGINIATKLITRYYLNETLIQCRFNVRPTSATLVQHCVVTFRCHTLPNGQSLRDHVTSLGERQIRPDRSVCIQPSERTVDNMVFIILTVGWYLVDIDSLYFTVFCYSDISYNGVKSERSSHFCAFLTSILFWKGMCYILHMIVLLAWCIEWWCRMLLPLNLHSGQVI